MTRIGQSLLAAAAAAVLVAGGCGGITGPGGADVGAVSFVYAGAEWGVFSARGVRGDDWGTRTYAAGQALESPVHTRVFAYSLRRGGVADQFLLAGDVSGPGTFPLADEHRAGAFYGELALDAVTAQNTARAIYVLTSGSVTLEAERGGRIRGRFEGTARLLNGDAVVQISDGRFDVPDNLPRPVD